MEMQQLFDVGECPIAFTDRRVGLVIRWDMPRAELGVQIPGYENLVWIPASAILCGVFGTLVAACPAPADELPQGQP